MQIADAIIKLRNEKGWNRNKLRMLSGVSSGLLDKIEEGKVLRPTKKTIRRLSLAFGTDIMSLLVNDLASELQLLVEKYGLAEVRKAVTKLVDDKLEKLERQVKGITNELRDLQ